MTNFRVSAFGLDLGSVLGSVLGSLLGISLGAFGTVQPRTTASTKRISAPSTVVGPSVSCSATASAG